MINANKEILQSFFQNNIQYEIPFFQRSYVWEDENWQTFWDHLDIEVEAYKNGELSEHFIGTIITKQKESQALGEIKVELIDGQQRLTTVAIFLKAIEFTGQEILINLKSTIQSLLKFENSRGEEFLRIEHSKHDAPYFKAILKDEDLSQLPNQKNNILLAFYFFVEKLKDLSDDDRDTFKNVLLQKVPVISMLLSKEDDEQEIFDTINSLGVRLTTGELLKNFIYKNKDLQPLYSSTWQNIFEEDDTSIKFWGSKRTSGRIHRTNIEVLLYCYLIIQLGDDIRIEKLFKEYKIYIGQKSTLEQKVFLHDLNAYAYIFSTFPSGSDINLLCFNDKERRFFRVLEGIEVSTAFPLVLFLYQTISDKNDLLKTLEVLESYLVRRNICKFTTKNYNKLFVQIINELKKSTFVNSKMLYDLLISFSDETNKFPSDTEVKDAVHKVIPSNKHAREILFIIALKDLDSSYATVNTLELSKLSVEHIMPKEWEENWPEPTFTDIQKNQRYHSIRTLGNLTLITQPLNSKLRNSSWSNKSTILSQYSMLNMTIAYLTSSTWTEKSIHDRGTTLAEKAIDIWKFNY
jgi:uncharacterized protein with ParB-like and HNH nuclease domain